MESAESEDSAMLQSQPETACGGESQAQTAPTQSATAANSLAQTIGRPSVQPSQTQTNQGSSTPVLAANQAGELSTGFHSFYQYNPMM